MMVCCVNFRFFPRSKTHIQQPYPPVKLWSQQPHLIFRGMLHSSKEARSYLLLSWKNLWCRSLQHHSWPWILHIFSQIFSTATLELKVEQFIGQEDGHHDGCLWARFPGVRIFWSNWMQSNRGNAILLESMGRLILFNWRYGCLVYDYPTLVRTPNSLPVKQCHISPCNQGVA